MDRRRIVVLSDGALFLSRSQTLILVNIVCHDSTPERDFLQ